MLIFELVTEGLWASFRQFDDFPQSIGLYLAMFQFLFLALGALGVKVNLGETSVPVVQSLYAVSLLPPTRPNCGHLRLIGRDKFEIPPTSVRAGVQALQSEADLKAGAGP
eukprot:701678-Prorocentrum_minimum.AAC.1